MSDDNPKAEDEEGREDEPLVAASERAAAASVVLCSKNVWVATNPPSKILTYGNPLFNKNNAALCKCDKSSLPALATCSLNRCAAVIPPSLPPPPMIAPLISIPVPIKSKCIEPLNPSKSVNNLVISSGSSKRAGSR
jgi:hypothetical protein